MKVYALKNCDTCRKAIKALREASKEFDVVDVREDGLKTEDIAKIVEAVGFERALNRRSSTWRALDNPDDGSVDNVRAVTLIDAHPLLLKRPAITDGETTTVGWDKAVEETWL